MRIAWGVVVLALSIICWGGQTLSWFAPAVASRLGFAEAEDDVEAAIWADMRGEQAWDALTLWTMVVAAVLLIVDESAWAYFGLGGGGAYLYFSGRGIFARLSMRGRALRIGAPDDVRVGLAALAIWAVMAVVTIAVAVADLLSA